MNVLELDNDNQIVKVCKEHGYNNHCDFIAISYLTISVLTFHDDNGNEKKLNVNKYNPLKYFLYWMKKIKYDKGRDLDFLEYMSLTSQDFDEVWDQPFDLNNLIDSLPKASKEQDDAASIMSPASARKPAASPAKSTRVSNLRKAIKMDATVYPALTNMSLWDNWNRAFCSYAIAQGIGDVLDKNYIPLLIKDNDVFAIKQQFLFAVLNWCIQTDARKCIVCKHKATGDAQAIYQDLLKEAWKLTAAQIAINKKIEWLTTYKILSWKGLKVGFIRHWENKMQELKMITKINKHYSDSAKRRMLEASVNLWLNSRAFELSMT